MGVDITMHIVRNKEKIFEDIFDGRNYDFFHGLTNTCPEHSLGDRSGFLNKQHGWENKEEQKKLEELGYYNFYTVKVKDYIEWYKFYEPNMRAGWITRKQAWLLDHYNIEPDDYFSSLNKDDITKDMIFKDWETYDCGYKYLYDFINDNHLEANDQIIYCFDC